MHTSLACPCDSKGLQYNNRYLKMIVCIAEKPSVARDIASVLASMQGGNVITKTQQGYIDCGRYQVTWVFGHLCELKEPHEYAPQWKRWDLWSLPMIPPRFGIRLKEDDGVKRQFATIQNLVSSAEMIINCGDAGQEGELIQRWVMQKAGVKCPVKRLWISSLTEDAIREGFGSLKDQSEYQSLYEAGLSRAIGDWTLGMNATRLYTLKYQQARGQVLSIGRVQTPTLALIVKRQQEIESFVPKQSWVLSTIYRDTRFTAIAHDEDAEAEAAAEVAEAAAQGKKLKPKGPIYRTIEYSTEEEGRAMLNLIADKPFTVTSIQKKKGTEAPPRLYDLTSLQVDCNRKFGYSADQTLQLIQSLYEKKFTTYPRVDTTYLSDDIYPKCPQTLAGIRGYEQYTQPLMGQKLIKSKKVFDSSKVTDHHAIIPTGVPAVSLTDMERKVYDLVTRAFIAVFYPDCKFETTTVMGTSPEADEALADGKTNILFRTSGRTIIEEGWKVIYKNDKQEADDANASESQQEAVAGMPLFKKGEQGSHNPLLTEKWTQPPKPYTEATLLRAMETAGKLVDNEELRDLLKENGIGRPSTRAAIIETLFKRHYIRKERKNLIATPTGVELIGIIHEELLKSAELTGQWEKKLRDIEHHTYEARQFIEELKQMVTEIVMTVRSDNSNRRVAVTTDEDLKKKSKPTKPRTKSKPKDKGGDSDQTNGDASAAVADAGNPPRSPQPGADAMRVPAGFMPSRQKRTSSPQQAVAPTPQSPGAEDEWVGLPCPLCHEGHIIRGRTAYGCSRWREGCTYRMPLG